MFNKLLSFIKKHQTLFIAIGIYSLAVLARIAYTYFYRGEYTIYVGDEGFFGQIAENLAKGNGFTFHGEFYGSRSPLITLIAALWTMLVGYSINKIHVCGLLLGATIPLITYYLGYYLTRSSRTALIAGLYTALYPFLIHESSFIDTENIFIPLLLLLYIAILNLLKEPRLRNSFIVGLLFGGVLLARSTLLLFIPFLLCFLLLKKWSITQIVQHACILIIGTILIISPWTLFASTQYKTFTLLTQGTNSTFAGSNNHITLNNPKYSGSWVNLDRDFPEEISKLTNGEYTNYIPAEKEVHYTILLWRDNLPKLPLFFLNKMKHFWIGIPKHPDNNTVKDYSIAILTYSWLLPFFVWYMFIKKPYGADVFWLFAAYFCFVSLITYGSTRFRLPLDPLIIIFSIAAITTLLIEHKHTQKK